MHLQDPFRIALVLCGHKHLHAMKMLLPITAMLALSITACGQKLSESEVPQPVKAAFAKQFPGAERAKWELEDKKDYEVNFKQGGSAMSAKYSADGKWLETEQAIQAAMLPAAVHDAIAKDYAGHKLEEIERAERPDGLFYEVELEKGEQTLDVVFAPDGRVVKRTVSEERKEKKD